MFILDPHPQCKQKMYCTVTHMIGSAIHFLFKLRMRMRIEYELGLIMCEDVQSVTLGGKTDWVHLNFSPKRIQ